MRRWRLGGCIALAICTACGHSGSSSGASASTASIAPITGANTTTTTTTPPPPTTRPSHYAAGPIPFTTADGWQYTFQPEIGSVSVVASKDVRNSPPGHAQLVIEFGISDQSFPGVVTPSTPGRVPPATLFGFSRLSWPKTAAGDQFSKDHYYGDRVVPEGCDVFSCSAKSGGSWTSIGEEAAEASVDSFLNLGTMTGDPRVVVTINILADPGGVTPKQVYITLHPDGTFDVHNS